MFRKFSLLNYQICVLFSWGCFFAIAYYFTYCYPRGTQAVTWDTPMMLATVAAPIVGGLSACLGLWYASCFEGRVRDKAVLLAGALLPLLVHFHVQIARLMYYFR